MIKLLAVFVTITAAAMTAVAAWDRGGTGIDKALLVALSVVIVLAVHLLPALSRRPVAWLVWSVCLLCAIYGHLTFLTHASLRAADTHAQQSALSRHIDRQIATAHAALDEIKARPMATVAAELAQESDRRVRAALRAEIAEGQRAARLRDDLARFEEESKVVQVDGASDPVTTRLSAVTGWTESAVSVVIGLSFSILLELIGALLWFEALRPRMASQSPAVADEGPLTQSITEDATDPVTKVTDAIKAGRCEPTVAGIRGFLKCGQTRAMEIRRVIIEGATA